MVRNLFIITKAFLNKKMNPICSNTLFLSNRVEDLTSKMGNNIARTGRKYFSQSETMSLKELDLELAKNEKFLDKTDLLITLGGDGTFL